MTAVLIYDISRDRLRGKVADACLDYGLHRIQFSAFFGEISANHLEELLQRIRRLAGKEDLRVEVFPLCAKDLKLRKTLVQHRLGAGRAVKDPEGPCARGADGRRPRPPRKRSDAQGAAARPTEPAGAGACESAEDEDPFEDGKGA